MLEGHRLTHVMVLNPGLGNWNQWLLGEEPPGNGPPNENNIPTMPPFNRNNGYMVPAEGDVIPFSALTPHPTDSAQYPLFRTELFQEALSAGRIGVVNGEYLKKSMRDEILRYAPNTEFVDLTVEFDAMKAVKSPEEFTMIEQAAVIYDRAFSTMGLILQSGRTEHDAAVELRFRLSQLGASTQDVGLLTAVKMVSAPQDSPRENEPQTHPGRRIKNQDRIDVIVNGYVPGGYAAALGRCYIVGTPTEQTRKDWEVAVKAQHFAADAAKPGVCLREIKNELLTQVLEPNGFLLEETCWMYGIGGYRCEVPRVSDDTANMPLRAGMALAIGPSIRRGNQNAYCCMDVYRITESGAVRLSSTSQKLKILSGAAGQEVL